MTISLHRRVASRLKSHAKRLLRRTSSHTDRDVVRSSDLFDAAWYHKSYPDLPPESDAVDHYLAYGAAEGRNPGPLFDGSYYLERNPDVARANTNPLTHYILWGSKENRDTQSVGVARGEGESIPLSVKPTLPGSIAVMIHAFYPDVFEELCAMLPNIPGHFSLYVAVPSASVHKKVQAAVHAHNLDADVVIKVCRNRGRNFGPFLVEFSSEIVRHDFVLHLHTKKSLYTGSEQYSWRKHLYETLIGSRRLVLATLHEFAADESLGLIYPSTAELMPYWAHHWLSNGHLVHDLFKRLGVESYQSSGFIDYPVGGMFWARVDAIRPVLTASFSYEDFPPENGQTDGTLAHAIERCFVQVAKARDYDFIEMDYQAGAMRRNWSAKNLTQYASRSPELLEKAILEAELVSFDIFDTLILRPSQTPDAVLRYIGHLFSQKHPTITDFFSVRKAAEHAARGVKNFDGDVDLAEIYDQFTTFASWTEELAAEAQALELEFDVGVMQPRPAGVEAVKFAHKAGKRVIAISDTYFPLSVVMQILGSAGVADCFDEIYISSDRQARKDMGDLWQLVMEREKTPLARWVHIGDNEHSDVQLPSDRGIGVFSLMSASNLTSLRGLSSPDATGKRWGTDLIMGPVVNRVGGDPFVSGRRIRPLVLDKPEDVGYVVFGPIMLSFVAWMATHPATQYLKHMYFASREGYALQRYYETVRSYCGDRHMPESTYFLTSRQTVLATAQGRRFAPDEIIGGTGFTGTLQSFLQNRLGLTLPKQVATKDIDVKLPEDTSVVSDLLSVISTSIISHGQKELELYLEYCENIGIAKQYPTAIVDVGYSATIQRNLQIILGRGFVGYYMATFEEADKVADEDGYAYGCFSEGWPAWTSRAPAVQQSLLLEAFLTAPHGQLVSFHRDVTGLEPVFKSDPRSKDVLDTLQRMQDGADSYCHDVLRTYGPSILDTPIDLRAVQEPLHLLSMKHIQVSKQVARSLAVEDDFTGSGELPVGAKLNTAAM